MNLGIFLFLHYSFNGITSRAYRRKPHAKIPIVPEIERFESELFWPFQTAHEY